MEFLTAEFLSLVGSSLVGFLFRSNAERRKEQAEVFNRIIEANKASNESHDSATDRVSISAGKWVRRLIVCCCLFGVILAPFILSVLGMSTIVQVEETGSEFLFGLFGGGTTISFVELKGYLLVPEVRQTLTALVGFYFGNATAARK